MYKISIDGVHLNCRTAGLPESAPAALLIHGLNTNLAFWHPALVRILGKLRCLVMYDQRGHGYSDISSAGYKCHELAGDAVRVLDAHNIKRADIIAHSFGTTVALQLVRIYPERVRSLVILDARSRLFQSDPKLGDWKLFERWRRHFADAGIDISPDTPADYMLPLRLEGVDFSKVAERLGADNFFVPQNGARAANKYKELLTTTTARDDFADTTGINVAFLRTVKHPLLLIYGSMSPFLASRDGLKATLPECRCEMVADVGHNFPFMRPEETARHIENFWTASESCPVAVPDVAANGQAESPQTLTAAMSRWYDALMYEPDFNSFFDHSDHANFGYWSDATQSASEAGEQLIERLLAFLPKRCGKILDVACGKGASTRQLLRDYPAENVTAINISEKQLEQVRRNAPGVDARCMDAAHLDFPDGSFDSILCVEAAFHFYTRERFLQEALRVLKPGGWLVLSDLLMTRDADERRKFRHVENYLANPSEYNALLARVGFGEREVIDATEQCFHGIYRHMVRYFHRRFLTKQLNAASVTSRLDNIYRHVEDTTYYLLVAAQKPEN
jgi:pimeloyl-ACP methyl ester carboxylesterase/SAM-dependent methyltransferase